MPTGHKLAFFFTTILTALVCAPTSGQTSASKTARLLLPETNTTISIRYASSKDNPEIFRTLIFKVGVQTYRLTSRYDLDYLGPHVDGIGLQPSDPIGGLTIDRARLFFKSQYETGAKSHTLLFFVGNDGITCSPILIVGFHDDGSPYKVLELEHFCADHFARPSGESPFFVGRQYLSEVVSAKGDYDPKKPYATTYDPYFVYSFALGAPAQYSLAASKLYNQQRYAWAGPHSREDFAVVYNLPGHPHPFGIPASRLETILK